MVYCKTQLLRGVYTVTRVFKYYDIKMTMEEIQISLSMNGNGR